ncbi:MAG TPA: MarR family transcriptional regulator [Candidatus Acidoferrales bacterium]|nr:MarR family transcriptional regulator [Candidatus Acidoferrales bacterium]
MERMATCGFKGVRESHGYLIQHLVESDRSITELASRMEVTQQAASKTVAELIDLGIVEAIAAKDRRAKRIRLSQRGWKCVRLGRLARARIDGNLVRTARKKNYEMARTSLLTCLRALGSIERIRSRRVRAPR